MDANVNTRPSVKKVREWPKFDFLNFFVSARELVAKALKRGKNAVELNVDTVGDSVIKKDYSRLNVNSSNKVEKFSKPNEITSKSVRNSIDEEFTKKYSKKNER